MVDFRFTNEHRGGVGKVMDVLKSPRLWVAGTDYPDYYEWLQRVEAQLQTGEKRAMLASLGGVPAGAVVYQRHRTRADTVEVKNISVAPETAGRYVGSFMLRNVEVEAGHDFPGCMEMIVDTKITNTGMLAFLGRHAYVIEEITDLYGLGAPEDAILTKTLAA